jgi:hypothetical protein
MTRHTWPPKEDWHAITAQESPDGNERIVRQCLACHLVKETVITPHANGAWHEWITSSGTAWIGEATPPCIPKGEPIELKTEYVSG